MNKYHITQEKFTRMVHELVRQISLSEFTPDYIVGLTRGGLVPANMISQYFDIPMASLDVSLRDNDVMGPESNCWMAEDAFNGKKILIVDDINDSGATLQWIKDDWQSGCLPDDPKWDTIFGDNVKIATVVHNESSDWQDIDFSAMEINKAEKDVWLVFPWENWWRT